MPNTQHYQLIVAHVERLRQIAGFESARIVFCPESNLGAEGMRLTADLARVHLHNAIVLHEGKNHEEGFLTTDVTKKQMAVAFQRALLDRSVFFHPQLVTANSVQGHTPVSMRRLVVDELLAYRRVLEYSQSDPDKLPREKYTGKVGGNCDDHAIAIQLLMACREVYDRKRQFYEQQPMIYTPGDEHAVAPNPFL